MKRHHGTGTLARRAWRWAALAALGVVLAAAATGCVGLDELRQARDRASALRDGLAARATELDELLERVGPDDPRRPEIKAQLEEARAAHAVVSAALRRADQVLAEAERPSGPISRAVGLIAPWVPEPARTPMVLGAALLGTALRARQLREASASIARGLDRAMEDDPDLAQQLQRHAATLRSSQTPTAARIVERTKAERRARATQEGRAR